MGDRASDNEDVRNDFLEALLKLFQENPGAEASVTALCAKAGYSRSTFYRYFDSLPEAYETLEDRVVPTGVLQALVWWPAAIPCAWRTSRARFWARSPQANAS